MHNAVDVRIKIAATDLWTIISEDRAKGSANLRPDLVLKKNNYILIKDITIPFENGLEALEEARQRKFDKYSDLVKELSVKTVPPGPKLLSLALWIPWIARMTK